MVLVSDLATHFGHAFAAREPAESLPPVLADSFPAGIAPHCEAQAIVLASSS